MTAFVKTIVTTVGIGIPWFTILYFSNPILFESLSSIQIFLLGISFAICKDLTIWGLKD